MAYAPYSSTSPNPPVLAVNPMAFGGGSTFNSTVGSTLLGGRLWLYTSTHLQTDVGTSDFISDGLALGMKGGDCILATKITAGASAVSFHAVRTVGSTFVSCSPGLVISSAS